MSLRPEWQTVARPYFLTLSCGTITNSYYNLRRPTVGGLNKRSKYNRIKMAIRRLRIAILHTNTWVCRKIVIMLALCNNADKSNPPDLGINNIVFYSIESSWLFLCGQDDRADHHHHYDRPMQHKLIVRLINTDGRGIK